MGKIFIISAPSGAGKTSLVNALLAKVDKEFLLERVVTYTTKEPRIGEIHGKDYHFVSKDGFLELVQQGFFLEWSTAYGAYYGSPRSIVEHMQKGRSYILIIDRVGAQKVFDQLPHAILIWIIVKDVAILHERLLQRGTDSQEKIAFRLAQAQKEIELEQQQSLYHYYIINEIFDDALNQLEHIVRNALTKNKSLSTNVASLNAAHETRPKI